MTTISFLSTVPSRSLVPSTSVTSAPAWRERAVALGTDAYVGAAAIRHNSMGSNPAATAGYLAVRGAENAAKQAAPPRGIPR